MKKKTIAVTGLLVLALTGFGASAAMASTLTPPSPSVSSTPSVSTPVTSTSAAPKSDAEVPDSTEVAGTESATASDGNDGGHADPEGVDVNNEAGGAEK